MTTSRVPPPGVGPVGVPARSTPTPTPTTADVDAPPAAPAAAPAAPKDTWVSRSVDALVNAGAVLGNLIPGRRAPTGGTSYDWNPSRPVDAVPLPPLLEQLATTPEGRQVAAQIANDFYAYTGIPGAKALAEQALANPKALTEGLIVTPGQLSGGLETLGTVKGATPVGATTSNLPRQFDLNKLAALPYENPFKKAAKPGPDGKPPLPGETDALKMLAPGL